MILKVNFLKYLAFIYLLLIECLNANFGSLALVYYIIKSVIFMYDECSYANIDKERAFIVNYNY